MVIITKANLQETTFSKTYKLNQVVEKSLIFNPLVLFQNGSQQRIRIGRFLLFVMQAT